MTDDRARHRVSLEPTDDPERRVRITRRKIIGVVAVIAFLVIVYVVVVSLYAASTRTDLLADACAEPEAGTLQLGMTPQSMDAAADRLNASLRVRDVRAAGLDGRPFTVFVYPNDGDGAYTIDTSETPIPPATTLKLITDGEIEAWPFDRHVVDLRVLATAGSGDDLRQVPVQLCADAHVPGWRFTGELLPGTDEISFNDQPVQILQLTATRSGATVAFGLVILVSMAALPVFALTVAILAFTGHRKVEATLTSWMAAMLFAIIPLRGFLPGSPPVGSWVDYLIVLWAAVGLVIGLAIYVLAWIRWTPAATAPRR